MSASTVTCAKCGHISDVTASYCTNCGSPLKAEAPAEYDYEAQRARDRTRTGLLLLLIAFVLTVIPFVSIVGAIVAIPAVIMMLLGAEAFGRRHRSFVLWSIISFVVLLVAAVATLVALVMQLLVAQIGDEPRERLEGIWLAISITVGVMVAASAIPYSLITYQLQDARGRKVLFGAVGVQLAYSVGIYWYTYGLLDVLLEVLEGGVTDIAVFTGNPLQFVLPLANLAWVAVYYLAYRRVTIS